MGIKKFKYEFACMRDENRSLHPIQWTFSTSFTRKLCKFYDTHVTQNQNELFGFGWTPTSLPGINRIHVNLSAQFFPPLLLCRKLFSSTRTLIIFLYRHTDEHQSITYVVCLKNEKKTNSRVRFNSAQFYSRNCIH